MSTIIKNPLDLRLATARRLSNAYGGQRIGQHHYNTFYEINSYYVHSIPLHEKWNRRPTSGGNGAGGNGAGGNGAGGNGAGGDGAGGGGTS